MKLVIDLPKKTYNEIKERTIVTCGETFAKKLIRYIANGTPLPKCHNFIAICDNDYPLSEEVIDDLKSTVFVGDIDDSGRSMYCFTVEEIIEGSESE